MRKSSWPNWTTTAIFSFIWLPLMITPMMGQVASTSPSALTNTVSQVMLVQALAESYRDDAVPALMAILANSSYPARKAAAEALGVRGDSLALPGLLNALKDPNDTDLRIIAAYALGLIQEPDAIDPLIGALSDTKANVRYASSNALGMFGEKALEPLLQHYAKADVTQKSRLLSALGAIGTPKALQSILPEIQSDEKTIRVSAISALGNFFDAQVIEILIATLKDDDAHVRASAVMALSESPDPKAIPALIQAVNDSDIKVSASAVTALAAIHDPRSVDALFNAVLSKNLYTKLQAIMAVGKLDDPRALPILRNTLNTGEPVFQWAAMTALAAKRDREAIPTIVKLTNVINTNKQQRSLGLAAIKALGDIGDRQGITQLLIVLGNETDPQVQEMVITSLGKIGDGRVLPSLLPFLNSTNLSVQQSTVIALGQCQDKRATDALLELAKKHNLPVALRVNILWALGEIKDKKAIRLIINILDDMNPGIPEAAATALGTIGDDDAIDPLVTALKRTGKMLPFGALGSPYPVDTLSEVRKAAAIALGKQKVIRALPDLIELAATDSYLAPDILQSLVQFGEPAVEALLTAKDTAEHGKQIIALRGLGLMKNQKAIAPLLAKLDDHDSELRATAVYALGQLQATAAVKPLMAMLSDKASLVRINAAFALWVIGDEAGRKEVVAVLQTAEPAIRADIAKGLGLTKDKVAVEPLVMALNSDSPLVRNRISLALHNIAGEEYGGNRYRWQHWIKVQRME